MRTDYVLHGWHLSYYTGKVLCYLRYKNIPFQGPRANALTLTHQIRKRFGAAVMPVLVTPQGEWLQDSSHIIDQLEQRNPARSVIPEDPVARFASYLLEAWGDEWWVPIAMHSRWSYAENHAPFVREAGQQMLPGFPGVLQRKAGQRVANTLQGMLQRAGVRAEQFDVLERWTTGMLDQLETHFAQHAYLFGSAPTLADFGLVGTFYGHLARDPWPARQWLAQRPHLQAWVQRMATTPNTTPKPNGALPDTLLPILRTVFAEFTPYVAQINEQVNATITQQGHAKPLRRSLQDVPAHTSVGTFHRAAMPYTLWMVQRTLDSLNAMPLDAQQHVHTWATALGGEAFLALDIPRLTRKGLRVQAMAAPS